MKRIAALAILLVFSLTIYSQSGDTLTLEYCYQQVIKNYPLAGQTALLNQSSELRTSNLNKNYLPQINLNGNASLQSEVTEVTINLPPPLPTMTGPNISKDWYKLTLDVNQSIYDGNITSKQKKLEQATLQADQKNVEVQLYQLKDRVNQLYFSIFFFQQNAQIYKDTKGTLESRLKEIRSAVSNGTMMSSAADAIQVELLRLDQFISENRINTESAFKMLSELISVPLSPDANLILPDVKISSFAYENRRPEYQLLDLQQNRIGTMKSMVISKWNPKFGAYGELGYGRPGLNMLSNDFGPWWIIGARFTWNFWNWNQNKNERAILDIQSNIITTEKETFDKNLRIASERDLAEINKLIEILKQDEEIIELRKKITHTTSSQMENGTVTSSEYISRLNEEITAKVTYQLHQIQLVKAKQTYLFTLGKL